MARAQVRSHAPDYALLSVVAVLVVIGLVAVYSSSYVLGEAQFGDANYFIKRQLLFALLGSTGLVVMMRLDYHYLSARSPLIMLVALVALAAVLLPGIGVEANEARRWVKVGPLPALQPSEFAKLAVIIYLSAWLAAKGDIVRSMTLGVLPFVVMVGMVGALIMREPDLGTAVMIALITGSLFFVAGAKLSHVFTLVLSTVAVASALIVTSSPNLVTFCISLASTCRFALTILPSAPNEARAASSFLTASSCTIKARIELVRAAPIPAKAATAASKPTRNLANFDPNDSTDVPTSFSPLVAFLVSASILILALRLRATHYTPLIVSSL